MTTQDPNELKAEVRPFFSVHDYELMLDYFFGADEAFLRKMGVDPAKLPKREAWLAALMADHQLDDLKKDRLWLMWIHKGSPVGHSSMNKIIFGQEGYIHLHMWNSKLRQHGLGTFFFRKSADYFAKRLGLKSIICEPYADNPAPNRVLQKAGFALVKKYRTSPGSIQFEQEVNRYELAI